MSFFKSVRQTVTENKPLLYGLLGGFIFFLTYTAIKGIETIEAGHVGVLKRFGEVQEEVLNPGFNVVFPYGTEIVSLSTRIQKIQVETECFSKDLQEVHAKIALNYRLDKKMAWHVYDNIGINYKETVIHPAIEESVKACTSRYDAENIVVHREKVRTEIVGELTKKLKNHHLTITALSIENLDFSDKFNRAIDDKQEKYQHALMEKNILAIKKVQAEQKIAEARGEAQARLEKAKAEAEAQRLLHKTLTEPVLRAKLLDRWNGDVPLVVGGEKEGTAFLDVVAANQIRKAKKLKKVTSKPKKLRLKLRKRKPSKKK